MTKQLELLTFMAEAGCFSPTILTKLNSQGYETLQNEYISFDPNGIPDERGTLTQHAALTDHDQTLVRECLDWLGQGEPGDWADLHLLTITHKPHIGQAEETFRHILFGPPAHERNRADGTEE